MAPLRGEPDTPGKAALERRQPCAVSPIPSRPSPPRAGPSALPGGSRDARAAPEGWDPYGRPARRTQWLLSALAFHYGLDRSMQNEIVVLATGLDQYLREIFQHLD